MKTRLLDGHLTMNLAGYFYRYTGLQVGANEETPSGAIAVTTLNAAAATVKGVDFDMSYAVQGVDGLTLRTGLNFNRARYSSFPNAPCNDGQLISEGCNQLYSPLTGLYNAQNLTGRALVRAPDWEVTPTVDYTTRVGSNMKLTLGAGVLYSSSYYTNLIDYNTPGFLQNAYAKVNLNLALKGPDDRWEVALIGNNVNDKITAGQCYNEPLPGGVVLGGTVAGGTTRGPGGGDYPNCEAERGREVWLRFVVRPLSWMSSH
jgi:iron complex outermembrane receptor protein